MKVIFILLYICLAIPSMCQSVHKDTVRRYIEGNFYELIRTSTKVNNPQKGFYVEERLPFGRIYQSYFMPKLPIGKSLRATGLVKKYYLNGIIRFQGEKKDGKPINTNWFFYPSGDLKTKTIYDSLGQKTLQVSYFDSTFYEISEEVYFSVKPKVDSVVSFYKNGTVEKIKLQGIFDDAGYQVKLQTQIDSSGFRIISDGKGFIDLKNEEGETSLKGQYINGLKAGKWEERIKGVGYYEEYFSKDGKLLSGTLTTINGMSIDYTSEEKIPSFIGGRQALYRFITSNLHYSKEARDQKLSGKVIVRYTVSPLGELNDIKVIKSVHPVLDEEAKRVVSLTNGKWIPGFQRGRAQNVMYTIPISFKTL